MLNLSLARPRVLSFSLLFLFPLSLTHMSSQLNDNVVSLSEFLSLIETPVHQS